MNEDRLVKRILKSFEREFPRSCPRCKTTFKNYYEFINGSELLEHPVTYDEDFLNGTFKLSFNGVFAYYNCKCGDTITIRSVETNPLKMFRIMLWVKKRAKANG